MFRYNFYSENKIPLPVPAIAVTNENILKEPNINIFFKSAIREEEIRKKMYSVPYYNFTDEPDNFYYYWVDIIGQHKLFSKGDMQ